MYKKFFVFSVVVVLSGCTSLKGEEGMFRNRTHDYERAYSVEKLKIPSDLATLPRSQAFPDPGRDQNADIGVDIEPPFFDDEEMI